MSIGDIVIFWGNNTITGYHTTSNRIIWKINTEKFLMGTDCNKKIFSFNNKALFVTAIKPGADFVFCVDPQDGRILWAFTERINTEYRVIPSNTRGNLVPIINVRKENMVRKQYLVFIDLETGEKVKEICFQEKYASLKSGFLADDQLFICGAQLEKKLDLSVYNDEAIFRMDMNHLDGDCVKLMDGGVCSIYQKENYVYYILEYKYWNEDKKIQTQYTINQYDLKTGQNTSIPWPERANPFILQEIMDDYILASDKLMISWRTKKYEKGERKAALFDFNLKKFLWTDTYEYDFISTCDGIFFKNYESLRDYRDGSVIETNVQFGQYYAKLFYADDAFYFNIGEGVEVHIRGDLPSEVLQASSDRMKEYDFREEIKKFNIREYGLSNI